jgi:hypothetical protein
MRALTSCLSIVALSFMASGQNVNSNDETVPTKFDQTQFERLLGAWGYSKLPDIRSSGYHVVQAKDGATFTWTTKNIPFNRSSSEDVIWLHAVLEFKTPRSLYQVNKVNTFPSSFTKCYRRLDGSVDVSGFIDIGNDLNSNRAKEIIDSFAVIVGYADLVFDAPKGEAWNTLVGERPFEAPPLNPDEVIYGVSWQDMDVIVESQGWTYKGGGFVSVGIPGFHFTIDGVQMSLYGLEDVRMPPLTDSTVNVYARIDCPAEWVTGRFVTEYRERVRTVEIDKPGNKFVTLGISHDIHRGVTIRSFLGWITDLVSVSKEFRRRTEEEYKMRHPDIKAP